MDRARATNLYERSLAIFELVADARPGDLTAQRNLSIGLFNSAMMMERSQGPESARELWVRWCANLRERKANGFLESDLEDPLATACRKARA